MTVAPEDKQQDEIALERVRHSAAHVMAEAVQEIFPGARFGIGPTITDGFYYDFDLPRPLTPDDLPLIETKMREIIARDHPFVRETTTRQQARRTFADQLYKLELIDELPEDEEVTTYTQGSFTDLCRGPHVERTGEIGAFRLLSIAGAYWRGDETRPMLQRIYATAWPTGQQLDDYLARLEDMESRDHRRLNRQLGLYIAPEDIGGGLIIYGPKAGRIRTLVEDFWRQEHYANGYELLYTPHIGLGKLWETSGHLDFYQENMYSPMDIEGQDYYLKPMNCPFHVLFYRSQVRSYRELPLRWAELGTVYRFERSGVLHGLLRTRGFTQDDAHIICTPEQIEGEIAEVLRFSLHMWQAFGFDDYRLYVATRPDKAIGSNEQWTRAAAALEKVVQAQDLPFEVDPGGGAFYGPKIDLKINDALGREWQMTTIQFDFNLPERFDMTYVGADGAEHRPYMVHRALLGAWCRFFGLLIEHYGGAFPVWLAPEQVVIVPVADRHLEYAREAEMALRKAGIRVRLDARSERMNLKIRQAQLEKVPGMVIIGDREVGDGTVSVRLRSGARANDRPLETFVEAVREAVCERSRELALPD